MFYKRDLEGKDWDDLIQSIQWGKCILILGPGAVIDHEGIPLHGKLCKDLAERVGENYSGNSDDLFNFTEILRKQERWIRNRYDLIKNGYSIDQIHPIYDKLAFIPFKLIISTSPSNIIYESFLKNGIECQFEFYNYRKNQAMQLDIKPQDDNPVIYNLFGSTQEEDSVIFTHDDLFGFIFAILGTRKLPLGIQEEVKSAHNFVFLGFDFETWYVKILLRLLNSHTTEISYAPPWNVRYLKADTITFYRDNFNINFVGTKTKEFINTLYLKCMGAKMLRKVSKKQGVPNIFEQVNGLLKNDDIEDALEILDTYLIEIKNRELLEEIVIITGRWSRLKRQTRQGTLDKAAERIEHNQISVAILNILSQLKSLGGTNIETRVG